MIFDIILQAKKLICFWFCSDRNTLSVYKN